MTRGRRTRLLAVVLTASIAVLACSPKPSPSPSTATTPAPSPTATPQPTPAPVAGVDWGEPVRLPGSDYRAGAVHAASYDGRIIVASTVLTGDNLSIAIWSSTDGVEWTVDTPDELANSRASGLVVGRDGLVLAGVAGAPRYQAPGTATGRPAVWTSRDGRSWTAAGGFPADAGGISDIAGDASGFLAVGYEAGAPPDGSCPRGVAWRSSDGTAWEALPRPAECAAVHSVVGHDRTFVVLGQLPDPIPANAIAGLSVQVAWIVSGETDWERLDAFPPPEARYSVVDGPDGFVAVVSALTGGAAEVSPVLVSADGRTWSRIDGDPFEPGEANHSPLAPLGYADGYFVGWTIGDGQGSGEIHLARSADGREWTIAPTSAALSRSPTLSSVLLHNGSVVAIGGRTGILVWVSPPAADGPAAPVLLEPEVVEASMPGAGAPRAVVFRGADALAVGSETDLASGLTVGRVWRWSAAGGWDAVAASGLEGAELSGLAAGPGGWLAIGMIRRPAAAPNQGWQRVPQAWSSRDGLAWTAASLDEEHIGVAIVRLTAVVTTGSSYVVSGWSQGVDMACGSDSLGSASVVLVSTDGNDWTVASDPDLACDQINDIAVLDGRLVAVGAENRMMVVPGPSPTPCDMDVCVSGGGRSEARATAWVSTDGLTWTRASELEAVWGRSGLTSVAAGPGGFVATSISDVLYTSPDGERWSTAYIPVGPSFQTLGLAAGSGDGYLAAGLTQTMEQYRYTLYFSADGTTWQEIAADSLHLERGTNIAAIDGADGAGYLVLGWRPGAEPAALSWQVALP